MEAIETITGGTSTSVLFFRRDLTCYGHFVCILSSHLSLTKTLRGGRVSSHFTGEKTEVFSASSGYEVSGSSSPHPSGWLDPSLPWGEGYQEADLQLEHEL